MNVPKTEKEFLKLLMEDPVLEDNLRIFVSQLDEKISAFLIQAFTQWLWKNSVSVDRVRKEEQVAAMCAYLKNKKLAGIYVKLA